MVHTLKSNYHKSFEVGLTASTTQTQGSGALTSNINEMSTVANANDTVTLPAAAEGFETAVINNGANTLQVFPASGDNLGNGLNLPTTIEAGTEKEFFGVDDTKWVNYGSADSLFITAFGEMVEDTSTGSSINTTTKLWSTAVVGELDTNDIVTFTDLTTGDKLVIGAGGAGTYQIHFSCSFTNAGGNITTANIYKNGVSDVFVAFKDCCSRMFYSFSSKTKNCHIGILRFVFDYHS